MMRDFFFLPSLVPRDVLVKVSSNLPAMFGGGDLLGRKRGVEGMSDEMNRRERPEGGWRGGQLDGVWSKKEVGSEPTGGAHG